MGICYGGLELHYKGKLDKIKIGKMYVYRSNFDTYRDYELTMILQENWHIICNVV
jgi:hypothetical protein